MPLPLLGQPSLSVRLDLQDSDGGRQSADTLQYLVDLTRPCSWRLLTCFVGLELLSVLFFLFFFLLLGTRFWNGVPLPLGLPFVGVHVGFFAPFYFIGAPLLASEHVVQREGKDVSVSLRCAGRGILESRQAKCGLLRDIGRGGLGNCCWRIHRRHPGRLKIGRASRM